MSNLTQYVKDPEEIEKMRIAGKLAAGVLTMIEPHIKAGVSTEELDVICHQYMVDELDSEPAPLTKGFPKGIKVNKTVTIPSELMGNIHNLLRGAAEKTGCKYHDIINELKIIEDEVYMIIKAALYRDAVLLSAESEEKSKAEDMILRWEKTITELTI